MFDETEGEQAGGGGQAGMTEPALDRILNPGTENEAVRQLRQPLTDQVAKPGRVPPEALTGGP